MIKNVPLAIGFALIIWAIIFAVISVVLFLPVVKDMAWLFWLIDWLAVGVTTFFLSQKYFQKVHGNVLDGITLGIFWVACGVTLDLVITIPLFVKRQIALQFGGDVTYADAAGYFFYQWQLWIGIVILILVSSLVAKWMFHKGTDLPNKFPES